MTRAAPVGPVPLSSRAVGYRSRPGGAAEQQPDPERDGQRLDRVAANRRGALPAELAEVFATELVGVLGPVLDLVGRLGRGLPGVAGPVAHLVARLVGEVTGL